MTSVPLSFDKLSRAISGLEGAASCVCVNTEVAGSWSSTEVCLSFVK